MSIINCVGVAMGVVLSYPHPQEVVLAAKSMFMYKSGRNLACGLQVTR